MDDLVAYHNLTSKVLSIATGLHGDDVSFYLVGVHKGYFYKLLPDRADKCSDAGGATCSTMMRVKVSQLSVEGKGPCPEPPGSAAPIVRLRRASVATGLAFAQRVMPTGV